MSGYTPSRISPRHTSVLTHIPHERIQVACLTRACRHHSHGPRAHQYRRPDPTTPAAVGSAKINPNRSQPTDGQTASPSPPTNQYSEVILAASFGGSDNDSDYVEVTKNSPTSPSDTPDLAGHIIKLEVMYEVSEGELDAIAQPTVLLSHTDDLKIPELSNT